MRSINKKIIITLISIFTCCYITVYSQNVTANSLEETLAATNNDAERLSILNKLFRKNQKTNHKKALMFAKQQLTLSQKMNSKDGEATSLDNISRLYYNTGEYKKSIKFGDSSLIVRKKLKYSNFKLVKANKSRIGKTYYRIGNSCFLLNDYIGAFENYYNSIEIMKSNDDKKDIVLVYMSLGRIYKLQGDYPEAIKNYTEALTISEKVKNKENIANIYNLIGKVYEAKKEFDKALENYIKAHDINVVINNIPGQAIAFRYIGKIHQQKDSTELALQFYMKSLEQQSKIKDDFEFAYINIELGLYYITQKEYKQALGYLINAEKISTTMKLPDAEMERKMAKGLSLAYAETGKYENAYKFHLKFKQFGDTINSQNNIRAISTFQLKYTNEEATVKMKAKQAAEKKTLQIVIISILGGLVLVLIMAFVAYRAYRQKQRDNKLLAEKNDEIESQRKLLEEKNKRINSSIRYAKTIQNAILPIQKKMDNLYECFTLYRPKDIVSGDFYWFFNLPANNDHFEMSFFAVVDCTGHGVPGAFMSMVGNSLLNEIVKVKKIYAPSKIMEELNHGIHISLKQTETDNNDGMDTCFCTLEKLDSEKTKVTFSGAGNPLYYFQKGNEKIKILKADNKSIGGMLSLRDKEPFTDQEILLSKGDSIYLSTDGLKDQNSPKKSRFGHKLITTTLTENVSQSMKDQNEAMAKVLDDFQGIAEQRDDITLLGIKV